MDILSLTAVELAKAIREGKTTAVEATQAVLDRIAAAEDVYHCYVTVERDKALQQAAEVQKKQVAQSGKNELFYAIQVASVPSKVKTPAKLCTGEKVEEINSGGRYRYYVAKDKELDVVKDCFIIAIYNNKVITVAEARKLESKK